MQTKARTQAKQKSYRLKETCKGQKVAGIVPAEPQRTITSSQHEVFESKQFGKSKGRNTFVNSLIDYYYDAVKIQKRKIEYSYIRERHATFKFSKPQLIGKIITYGKDKWRIKAKSYSFNYTPLYH